MYYLYESHAGGLYISDEELDYDWLYCEACGDSDEFVGTFETVEELKDLLGSVRGLRWYNNEEYIKRLLVKYKLPIGLN